MRFTFVLVKEVSVALSVQSTTSVVVSVPMAYSYLAISETTSVKTGQWADSVVSDPV